MMVIHARRYHEVVLLIKMFYALFFCCADCHDELQRFPRLHVLLCSGALAERQVVAIAAKLPSSGRPGRARETQRVLGYNSQQGSGTAKVEKSSTLQRKERSPLRGHLSNHT